MAQIGMRQLKFWPITTPRVDGQAITYGSPVVLSPAMSANITYENANGEDYGDDVIINTDQGINGYNIAMEIDDISPEGRVACLGWKEIKDSSTPPKTIAVRATDATPPEGGLSYIRKKMKKNGLIVYEPFFCHALKCSSGGENSETKRRNLEWRHQTMNAKGLGTYLDSSGEVAWFDSYEFDTLAKAEDWVNTMAGYTPPSP